MTGWSGESCSASGRFPLRRSSICAPRCLSPLAIWRRSKASQHGPPRIWSAFPRASSRSRPKQTRGVQRLRLREFLTDPRMLRLLLGTAGAWFLFDYAYYGNTLSLARHLEGCQPGGLARNQVVVVAGNVRDLRRPRLPVGRHEDGPHRTPKTPVHRVFRSWPLCFLVLAIVPALTQYVAPFLAILGLSYFFIQFGPNMTTFVLPSEVFPVSMRTTGHGVAAGIGKLGAFVGVFLVPVLQDHIGLRGLLAVAGVSALLGVTVTTLLPEPAGRTLEDVSAGDVDVPLEGASPLVVDPLHSPIRS